MIRYDSTTIGTMILKQGGKRFKLQIRKGNCLAVIIYVRKLTDEEILENPGSKYMHTLYDFYLDGKHLNKRLKNDGDVLGKDIVDVELNLFYEESQKLLKYFVKSGHKVKCYCEEEEIRNEEEES